jgi:hypothetical protein
LAVSLDEERMGEQPERELEHAKEANAAPWECGACGAAVDDCDEVCPECGQPVVLTGLSYRPQTRIWTRLIAWVLLLILGATVVAWVVLLLK